MARRKEHTNSAEIAAFLHTNENEAYVKTYTAVNEPMKIDSSQRTQKIGGVTVTMNVEEDTSVKRDGSFYEKRVWTEQHRDLGETNTNPGDRTDKPEQKNHEETKDDNDGTGPSGLQVLKNFVDKLAENQTMLWVVVTAIAIVAGVALALSITG